jgi:hypothetical protein
VAGLSGTGLEAAFRDAGEHPDAMIEALKKLGAEERRALLSGLRTQGGEITATMTEEQKRVVEDHRRTNEEMARQLEGAIGVSQGGFANMQNLSAGGSLAMRAAQVGGFGGVANINSSLANRAAAENLTGMSGHQMDSFISTIGAFQGDFETMTRLMKKTDRTSEEEATLRQLQQTHHVIADGTRITDANTHAAIMEGADLLTTSSSVAQSAIEDINQSAVDVAMKTMDATVSVADILENKVFQALQGIYDSISGPVLNILSRIPGLGDVGQRVQDQMAVGREIGNQIREIDRGSAGRARTQAGLQDELKRAKTPEERAAVRTRIEAASAERDRINLQRQNLVEARHRASESDFSGSRIAEDQWEAADIGDQVGEGLVDAVIGPLGQIIAEDQRAQRGENVSGRRTFRTREEAQAYAGRGGMVRAVSVRRRLTPQEMAAGLVQQAGAANAPAAAAPAAAAGAAPSQDELAAMVANANRITADAITSQVLAQVRVPGPSGASPVAASMGPAIPPAAAEAANRPAVDATESLQASTTQQNDKAKRLALKTAAQQHEDLQKMMEGRTLGDGLAQSKLPDAIAVADSKMRLLESLTTKQLEDKDLVNRLLGGTASPTEVANLTQAGPGGTGGAGIYGAIRHMARQAHDFVYQDRGGRSVITPIDREDQVTGGRPGGPIANAGGRPGGNVYITVNGGDQRQVFETVRRAIQQAGITPNRVPGGGG